METRVRMAYPIFIKKYDNDFLVYVPDFDSNTSGKSIEEAIFMARDVIGMLGMTLLDKKDEIPTPSSYDEAIEIAKKDADDDFDFSDGLLTLVDIDFEDYKRKYDNRKVKKNCTIPYYLNVEAEKRGINFSRVLQEALEEKIFIEAP